MKTETIHNARSWSFHSDRVSAAVTCEGGHLGPVEFSFGGRVVRPLHVAPWAGEKGARGLPTILRILRGDFFCMPFGGNGRAWRGERHPVHGETANAVWEKADWVVADVWSEFRTETAVSVRAGRVGKHILLRAGDAAVYSRHIISGMSGPMAIGHHAMLSFENGPARISCSPFVRGQVFPGAFEDPAQGGYGCLKPGAMFTRLDRVARADGGMADLSRYPARGGFEDLVMVSSRPGREAAWSAAVFEHERYVWFSLKDPRVLASTILWHSNGGRHYPPWNGRHRRVLGIEEVTANFHHGLAESAAPNPVSKDGIPTCVALSKSRPLVVNTIMGVAGVPRGFDIVRAVRLLPDGVELRSASGKSVAARLDTGFLYGDEGR